MLSYGKGSAVRERTCGTFPPLYHSIAYVLSFGVIMPRVR